jgi:ABC-type polysaccharide/polyol phosphate transport system ATPase subunit
MPAVSLQGVSKRYKIFPNQKDRLKEALTFGKLKTSHDFWALKDINLDVEPGTVIGILGRNGAGKTTLLKIVSGILQPSDGAVDIKGRLVALFQLGAGFNPEFTGRENVMLNGLILGIERREMFERFDEIEEFADLGEFMDQPVKTYSSGMRARLGFAVAVNVDPDVLIVDEVFSVGDAIFKAVGVQKMNELRDRGTTILFVSHSGQLVKNFCEEAALLHKGTLIARGNASQTVDYYQAMLSSLSDQPGEGDQLTEFNLDQDGGEDPEGGPRGTGEARIENVEVLDKDGAPANFVPMNAQVTVRAHVQYAEDLANSTLFITIRNRTGLDIFSTSTSLEKTPLKSRGAGERVIVDFRFRTALSHGLYSVTTGVFRGKTKKPRENYLDWIDVATTFHVEKPEKRGVVPGLVHIPTKVEILEPGQQQNSEQSA